MDKPWWLWDYAAVRNKHDGTLSKVCFEPGGNGTCGTINDLIPIENPAVMLAPKHAESVTIGIDSMITWWVPSDEYKPDGLVSYFHSVKWPQCPDHLKGKTWELPQ